MALLGGGGVYTRAIGEMCGEEEEAEAAYCREGRSERENKEV